MIILSDLHLGSPYCLSEKIMTFLAKFKGYPLILNGDTFDNSSPSFSLTEIKILEILSRRATVIQGNHDFLFPFDHWFLSPDTRVIDYPNLTITHGDQFDGDINFNSSPSRLAHFLYLQVGKVNKKVGNQFKYLLNWLTSCHNNVMTNSLKAFPKAKTIVCGHTHKAWHEQVNDQLYLNTGCWTDNEETYYGIIHNDYKVELCKFY